MTSATTAVTDSKAAKTKQDAIDQARTSLRNAIDAAQELLDGSPYKVADNATRVALENAISTAQVLIDGNSTDTKAMQNAISGIRRGSTTTVPDPSSSKTTESESPSPSAAKTPTDNETTNNQFLGSGEQPKPGVSTDTPKGGASGQSE